MRNERDIWHGRPAMPTRAPPARGGRSRPGWTRPPGPPPHAIPRDVDIAAAGSALRAAALGRRTADEVAQRRAPTCSTGVLRRRAATFARRRRARGSLLPRLGRLRVRSANPRSRPSAPRRFLLSCGGASAESGEDAPRTPARTPAGRRRIGLAAGMRSSVSVAATASGLRRPAPCSAGRLQATRSNASFARTQPSVATLAVVDQSLALSSRLRGAVKS